MHEGMSSGMRGGRLVLYVLFGYIRLCLTLPLETQMIWNLSRGPSLLLVSARGTWSLRHSHPQT